MGENITKLESKGIKVYQTSKSLAFALSPSRTVFLTPLGAFEILHSQLNSQPRYYKLRNEIIKGEYNNVCDLLTGMRLKAGIGVSYRALHSWELDEIQND